VRIRFKQVFLVICLFLFLYVVIGGGLHLTPSGALVAALTGTPLIVHVFKDWCRRSGVQDSHAVLEALESRHGT